MSRILYSPGVPLRRRRQKPRPSYMMKQSKETPLPRKGYGHRHRHLRSVPKYRFSRGRGPTFNHDRHRPSSRSQHGVFRGGTRRHSGPEGVLYRRQESLVRKTPSLGPITEPSVPSGTDDLGQLPPSVSPRESNRRPGPKEENFPLTVQVSVFL